MDRTGFILGVIVTVSNLALVAIGTNPAIIAVNVIGAVSGGFIMYFGWMRA